MATQFLKKATTLEIAKYQQTIDRNKLLKNCLAFSGSLRQHPNDKEKVILLPDPYGSDIMYYEFKNEDIFFAEKRPDIVNTEGDDVTMVMLWIKKGCVAIRSMPFIVDEIK
ncbi:MAG: inorganic pyrophosphatase Ppa [Gammaproteobacteria bacterium]|nr:inorganic pyrophosphatase Ppa [Gammaproteobacteria bacterium]